MRIERKVVVGIFIGVTAVLFVGMFFVPPIAQPDSYHHFSDARTFMGVPNALNVLSNAGFLVIGIAGVRVLLSRSRQIFISTHERVPYLVLFCGVLLTTFGSAYYHWAPSNATLVWDRLPMTFGFMGLFAGCISERIDLRAGQLLLWPMVLAGMVSVGYWWRSGDLRPYVLVQFYSLLGILLLMFLFKPRYTRGADIVAAVGLYALAKVCETYDAATYSALGFLSGHTLKHLVAAVASLVLLRMLYLREPAGQASEAASAH